MPHKTVLVIDDSADTRASLELLLPMFGYDVATAGNGLEALDYLHSHKPPCLILLDLRMPVMGGVQFRREQRRDPDLADIPTVVCAAEFDENTQEEMEVRAFCPKGDDPMGLVRVVQRHCR
jgi:CheY-like chemotaxis protein